MEDFSIDDSEFCIERPVWLVFNKQRASEILLVKGDKSECLPVFTDEDNALRFLEGNPGMANMKAREMATRQEFAEIMEKARKIGATCVVFDQRPGATHIRTMPIEKLIAATQGESP